MTRPAALALAALLAACGPGGTGEPGPARTDSPAEARPGPAGAADSTAPGPSDAPGDTTAAGTDGWTAGIVDLAPAARGAPILGAVRAARHEAGFDRVVWEFDGGRPGVHVEYVDEPVRECGSGRPVTLPGDAWLEVRMEPAAAHADGRSTIEVRRLEPGLPVVLEAVLTCDFEGVVAWVLAVDSPEPFRVRALESPTRVVVDVRHPGRR